MHLPFSASPVFRSGLARRFASGALVLAALACLAPVVRAAAAPVWSELMPVPAQLEFHEGRLAVTETFSVAVTGADDARLQGGIQHALARWEPRTGLRLQHPVVKDAAGAALVIACDGPGLAVPGVEENEAYTLEITPQQATLRAPTVVGALRGLETLLQLLQQDGNGFFLPATHVVDQPRFAWRGLMIDVVRHWQPIEMIKRNLDAMAVVKLNVLHLHLTDDQAFRVESKKYPELAEKASDGNYFTQDQIREIVAYAAARGIRVVPEFDMPGHAQAWAVSHPELASAPGPWEQLRIWGSNVVLDPTNEDLYTLLDGFLGEMAGLFPDAYLHIGGDENNGKEWKANEKIQAFIKEHNLKDNAALQTWFNQRLQKILQKYHKRMIGWDEILEPGLPTDSTIHAWRGITPKPLYEAVRKGYTSILSNGYYIDLIQPASQHYLIDPLPADNPLTPEEQKRVLGGEATMWAEWTPPETVDSRIWPRTAAIAERFWSPREVNDVADMYRRLAIVSARLEEAGAQHMKNYEPMLRRLVGGNPTTTQMAMLRAFVDSVEPLKQYTRGRNQKGVTQQTPLTGVVDCARPESETARVFTAGVEQLLALGRETDPTLTAMLREQARRWREAGLYVVRDLGPQAARLKDALPVAQGMADSADIADEALAAVSGDRELPADWREKQLAALEHANQPGQAALELPAVPAIRLLVLAATERESRATMDAAAWSKHLHELAAAKKAGKK